MHQPIYNLQRQKTAIFLDLRTLKPKNPYFSIPIPREFKLTILEDFLFFQNIFEFHKKPLLYPIAQKSKDNRKDWNNKIS